MVEKCCYNKFLMEIFFWGREVQDKRRQKNTREWSNFFFSNLSFWAYTKKNQHIHFLAHGLSSWSTYGLNQVRGPKAL
jgi:hypothetical protein